MMPTVRLITLCLALWAPPASAAATAVGAAAVGATAVGTTAAFGALSLDRSAPPVRVQGDLYRFAPGVEWRVDAAVVLHITDGRQPPTGAHSLGGKSWRLPVADAATAVQQALDLDPLPGLSAFPDVLLPLRTLQDTTQDTTQSTDPADFNDPLRGGQWYLDELGMDELFAVSLGTPETVIAVIDSAIDISHDDLVDAVVAPYDAYRDDDDPSPDPGEFCGDFSNDICDTHGTAVSGIVAARANNGTAMVGLCPLCTLVPIKLLGEGGTDPKLSIYTRAFEHAIEQDAAVMNNSWGFVEPQAVPITLAEVINRAATEPRDGKGALVVFAAGNDDREIGEGELEAMDSILCVSATDSYGNPTNYTNFGAFIDVAAPSATVSIAPDNGTTDSFGGTSGAAPVAAGLAAWAAAVDPSLTAMELKQLLIDTARPSPLVTFDENGHNDYYGYGIIDALAVRDALVGVEDSGDAQPAPGGCGCSGTSAGATGLLGLLALPLLWVRRRRTYRSWC